MNASKFWSKKCRRGESCAGGPHSHHLTLFGHFYFKFLAGGPK